MMFHYFRHVAVLLALLPAALVNAQHFFGLHQHLPEHASCKHGLEAIHEDAFVFVPPPVGFEPGAPRDAVISVTYNGFPADALDAFQYAVDIWASIITSTIPITIDANWLDLSSNALGFAGATGVYRNFSGAPIANTYYATALANKLSNSTLNVSASDIFCGFNANQNWYLGIDGNTPSGQFDFVTVVLHELCHGLGFFASISADNGGQYGFNGDPVIYDVFIENIEGIELTELINPSPSVIDFATSGNLFWNGANAVAANGPDQPRLFSPSNFQGGSSVSHLNEATYPPGTPDALMTPFLNSAEAIHDPGPVVTGILKDLGWAIGPCGVQSASVTNLGSCSPQTGTFQVQLTLTFDQPPSSGLLHVNGSVFPIGQSPRTVTLTREADGLPFTVTTFFTDQPECESVFEDLFTAPGPCDCPADFNGDGTVNTSDLLFFLAGFGCTSGCSIDLNGDGTTSAGDLMFFLSLFGTDCPE